MLQSRRKQMGRPPIEPMRTSRKLNFLDGQQLIDLQEATFRILEDTGVLFPSDKALDIFLEHGAIVDRDTQIVKFPRDVVIKAM
ncbi:MAG TPA: hypothetical protein ENF22_08845, partial [Chloroflexi bacterium]|nr:hypothetical protein [Chloroflexota bacterium]